MNDILTGSGSGVSAWTFRRRILACVFYDSKQTICYRDGDGGDSYTPGAVSSCPLMTRLRLAGSSLGKSSPPSLFRACASSGCHSRLRTRCAGVDMGMTCEAVESQWGVLCATSCGGGICMSTAGWAGGGEEVGEVGPARMGSAPGLSECSISCSACPERVSGSHRPCPIRSATQCYVNPLWRSIEAYCNVRRVSRAAGFLRETGRYGNMHFFA